MALYPHLEGGPALQRKVLTHSQRQSPSAKALLKHGQHPTQDASFKYVYASQQI